MFVRSFFGSLLLVASIVSFTGCSMWSTPAKGFAGATGGEQLERSFLEEVRQGEMVRVRRHLSANFIATDKSGHHTADEWMESLRQRKSQAYTVADLQIESQGADAIVSYTLVLQPTGSSSSVHSLSVWQQVTKGWMMVAHSESPANGQ